MFLLLGWPWTQRREGQWSFAHENITYSTSGHIGWLSVEPNKYLETMTTQCVIFSPAFHFPAQVAIRMHFHWVVTVSPKILSGLPTRLTNMTARWMTSMEKELSSIVSNLLFIFFLQGVCGDYSHRVRHRSSDLHVWYSVPNQNIPPISHMYLLFTSSILWLPPWKWSPHSWCRLQRTWEEEENNQKHGLDRQMSVWSGAHERQRERERERERKSVFEAVGAIQFGPGVSGTLPFQGKQGNYRQAHGAASQMW